MTNGGGKAQRGILRKIVRFLAGCFFFPHLSCWAEPAAITAIRVHTTEQADCRISSSGSYEDAVSAIACVLAREFNLSAHGIYFLFHSDQRVFESSLVSANRFDAAYARQTASWAVALSTSELIFVNEAALGRLLWHERVQVLAHELVHTIQYRFTRGRRSTSDQWLREGLAEWIASSIVDSLKLASFSQRKALALARVKKSALQGALPGLYRMVSFQDFAALRSSLGTPATYDQAFLAADLLTERHGLQAVLHYFRLFRLSDDRLQNFKTAFGKDLSTFEDEHRAHLQRFHP
jgi:hypothetical protein